MIRTKATNKRLRDEVQYNRKEIIELSGKACEICSFSNEAILEIHHILPLSQGGNNGWENLSVLCPNCHRSLHKVVDSKNTEEAIDTQSYFHSHNKENFLSLVAKSFSALIENLEMEREVEGKRLEILSPKVKQLEAHQQNE